MPVVVIEDVSHAEPLREALKVGGIYCAEVTFRTASAVQAIEIMSQDPEFTVGAGTVITPTQVDSALRAGAHFMVSPGISPSVVFACKEAEVPIFPGVITPSEIMRAIDLGLSELKFFPASTAGGVPALKALAGPFGQVSFVPTGGINAANAVEFLRLPNVAAIGGSWFVPVDSMANGDYLTITKLTAEAVRIANSQE
jgi:2-dehydro-3-deoxyphosphogluconate aldolase/(4S)-4-hydroxy-2-oxoglutarate aldolase